MHAGAFVSTGVILLALSEWLELFAQGGQLSVLTHVHRMKQRFASIMPYC